jgi:HD-GYP domain-containing protein (c-di-GMP phosphodiesterase class II)
VEAIARRRAGAVPLGRGGTALLLALLLGPALLLFVARSAPALDPVFESVRFHVVVVSAIAGCALLVALATAIASTRDGRAVPVLLALGCVCVGFLMLGHGLTTPGILGRPYNLWVSRLPTLALFGFAVALAAAAWTDGPAARIVSRLPRAALVVPVVILGVGTAVVALDPTALRGLVPAPGEESLVIVIRGFSIAALLVTGAVHWRRWRLGRDRVELSLVFASWLAMSAILSQGFGQLWRLSWWDYHLYLLAGFAATCWAVLAQYRRSRSLSEAVAGIAVRDPVEQISRGHPEALDALIGAVEAKDRYTYGHSARVAELSTRIGLRLGLDPASLRRLHQGASLHDLGKIGVPDQVLNKPGVLTEEEWIWIHAHPVVGFDLASRAPSLREAATAIRHHHERWDGSGYPDHLAGTDISVAGRVVAVADVWDAITSDRAYRPAWPLDRAVTHVAAGAGTLFDPVCVDALLDVLGESGLEPERTTLDAVALLAAAGSCHPETRRRRRAAPPHAQVGGS